MQYELVRSKRKSVAIQIKDGTVTVRAPLKTGIAVIEKFLESKSTWISRKLMESERRANIFSDVISGDRFVFLGKDLTVERSNSSRFYLKNDVLYLPSKYFNGDQLNKSGELFAALKRVYRKEAKSCLEIRLNEIGEKIGLKHSRFDLTGGKTKWGSCDSNNFVRLNWHLVMLDQALIDYVIVHELAHTVEHNHSARFWAIVSKFYPNYKEAIACLKNASVIIGLWC